MKPNATLFASRGTHTAHCARRFESRDPYFIMGGKDDPTGPGILWSQPEIMLYVLPKCEDSRCGLGYPDFIERGAAPYTINTNTSTDSNNNSNKNRGGGSSSGSGSGSNSTAGNGKWQLEGTRFDAAHANTFSANGGGTWRIMLSETDKEVSRTHALDMQLLHGLWFQAHITSVATKGVALHWQSQHNPDTLDGAPQNPPELRAPHFGNLSAGLGFSIEIAFRSERTAVATPTILFDCRSTAAAAAGGRRGVVLVQSGSTFGVVNISLADSVGNHQTWDTDRESKLRGGGGGNSRRKRGGNAASPPSAVPSKMVANHVVFTVDGASRTIMSVVNGKLSDGGTVRSHGWAHLGSHFDIAGGGGIGNVDGGPTCVVDPNAVLMVRVYNRYLSTTEAIGNWRNWTTTPP